MFARESDVGVHKLLHLRIRREIAVDELLRLIFRDGEVFGKAEIAHSVNYAEIDRLRVPALCGSDLALRNAEYLRRGERVYVGGVVVCLDEFFVPAEVG